jgi:ubiquinone/menaquinone biosynthesis C-methylase UbiE
LGYEEAINIQYGQKNLVEKILELLQSEGLNNAEKVKESFVPIEELHLLGSVATLELAQKVGLNDNMRILDVGCGIGGPARRIATKFGCRVTGLDLSKEYCQLAKMINDYIGISDLIEIKRGNALDMPFDDALFDVVFLQHVLMNIQNKNRLFSQIKRVLRPEGQLALYTICAGNITPINYPVIWANTPDINFLLSALDLRNLIISNGFKLFSWKEHTKEIIKAIDLQRTKTRSKKKSSINLGLIVKNPSLKWKNMILNLKEGRIKVIQGIFER